MASTEEGCALGSDSVVAEFVRAALCDDAVCRQNVGPALCATHADFFTLDHFQHFVVHGVEGWTWKSGHGFVFEVVTAFSTDCSILFLFFFQLAL